MTLDKLVKLIAKMEKVQEPHRVVARIKTGIFCVLPSIINFVLLLSAVY